MMDESLRDRMHEDGKLFRSFDLPPFTKLLKLAGNNIEKGCFTVSCKSIIEGKTRQLGLSLSIDNRQRRYWLPRDHPKFDSIMAVLRHADLNRTRVPMILDAYWHILIDIEDTVSNSPS